MSVRCSDCDTLLIYPWQIVCVDCLELAIERVRIALANYLQPTTDEFEGMSSKERHDTIEARRDTVLAECNSELPIYKPV